MGPAIIADVQAGVAFANPAQRAQFRLQHEQQVPLIDMLEAIVPKGTVIDPVLRDAITSLSPDEVAIIRKVMIEEIDRAGDSTQVTMPIKCEIDPVAGPVAVVEGQEDGRPVAVITTRK